MTIPIKTWSSRIIIVLFSVLLVLGIGSPVFAASLSGNWQIIESVQTPIYNTPTGCEVNVMVPLRYGASSWGRIHIVGRHGQGWVNNALIGNGGANATTDWIVGDVLMYGKLDASHYYRGMWQNLYSAWFTSALTPGQEWCQVTVVVDMENGAPGVITAFPSVGGVPGYGTYQFPNWLALVGAYSHS